MINWNEIAASVGLSAVTAATVLTAAWALIKAALEKRIEESIKHTFAVELDRQKTQNAIIIERCRHATSACDDLGLLVDEIMETIGIFQEGGGPDYIDNLLREVHPKFKRRYASIRHRFEVNDLFSAYSLMLDRLIHEQNVRELIEGLERKNRGNVRFLYGKMWLTTTEILRSIDRICVDYKFWDPSINYGERADMWAAYDFFKIKTFLASAAQGRDFKDRPEKNFSPFYISLEEKDGRQRFWIELPELPIEHQRES